jgi:hypothetical protein
MAVGKALAAERIRVAAEYEMSKPPQCRAADGIARCYGRATAEDGYCDRHGERV